MKRVLLLMAFGFVLSGCVERVDIEAARAALRQADVDWAAAVAAKDADAFASYFAPDAVVMPPHLPALNGTDAIRQWIDTSMGFPGFAVTWQVTSVEVAASGDLGYTLGNFTFHVTMPDGSPIDDRGKYATIWKKQSDGSWKVVVDVFNSDVEFMPTPAAGDTTRTQGE